MRQPLDDVLGVRLLKHLVGVIDPWLRFCCIAKLEARRSVQIEAGHASAINPTAVYDQSIGDQHWLSRAPGHAFDALVLIEPAGGAYDDRLAVLAALWFAGLGQYRNGRHAGVDAGADPDLAARLEDVDVARRIGDEVLDVNAAALSIGLDDLFAEAGIVIVIHA